MFPIIVSLTLFVFLVSFLGNWCQIKLLHQQSPWLKLFILSLTALFIRMGCCTGWQIAEREGGKRTAECGPHKREDPKERRATIVQSGRLQYNWGISDSGNGRGMSIQPIRPLEPLVAWPTHPCTPGPSCGSPPRPRVSGGGDCTLCLWWARDQQGPHRASQSGQCFAS